MLDKYEYKVRSDQLKALVEKEDFAMAMRIADTIDWSRVKSLSMLTMVSDVYKENKRYEDSRNILLMAYDRYPSGRAILYNLVEILIKTEEYVDAIEYYKEYVQIAPKDVGRHILQYKLYEAQGVGIEERIKVLQELKKKDYLEQWAFELAFLYHKAGLAEQCIEECDDLILWFGEGKYVIKAMELKMLYKPLSTYQQNKYNNFLNQDGVKSEKKNQEYTSEPDMEEEIEDVNEEDSTEEADDFSYHQTEEPQDSPYNKSEESEDFPYNKAEESQGFPYSNSQESDDFNYDKPQKSAKHDVDDIKIKDINPSKFSTINIQQELAKSMEFLFGKLEVEEEDVPEASEPEVGMTFHNSAEMYKDPDKEKVSVKDKDSVKEKDSEFDTMLTQEYDGQIGLCLPEKEAVEKQITGQMCIEEVLAEWEKLKTEEQKKLQVTRKKDLQDTQDILERLSDILPKRTNEEDNQGKDVKDALQFPKQAIPFENPVKPAVNPVSPLNPIENPFANLAKEINKDTIADAAEDEDFESEYEPVEELEDEEDAVVDFEAYKNMQEALEQAVLTNEKAVPEEVSELFKAYSFIKGLEVQIQEAVKNISDEPHKGNLLIIGDKETGKTSLAVDIVKAVELAKNSKRGKIAKINAEQLNTKDICKVVTQMDGGTIVIERAGLLTAKTVDDLISFIKEECNRLILILEDNKKEIDKVLQLNNEFSSWFTQKIEIPEFTNDDLVAFAKQYAMEQEYAIDEMGILALYMRISDMQIDDENKVSIVQIKEIMEEAIQSSKRKNLTHMMDIIFGKRYNREDQIILKERDFI